MGVSAGDGDGDGDWAVGRKRVVSLLHNFLAM